MPDPARTCAGAGILAPMPATICDYQHLSHEVVAICPRCGHQRVANLTQLIAAGLGDRTPASLPLLCRRGYRQIRRGSAALRKLASLS
jgi:hypothetical protein